MLYDGLFNLLTLNSLLVIIRVVGIHPIVKLYVERIKDTYIVK